MPLPATDDYSAVQAYFTAKEWVEISNYEKLRLKNIKENYEMMIELGLQVSPPYFMRPRRGRKKQFVEESDSEDEEWKPKRARKKSRGSVSTLSNAPAVKSNKPVNTKKQPEPKPHTVTSGTVYDDDGNPLNNAHPTVSEIIIDLLEWKDYADSTQTQTNPTASSGDQGNPSGDQETEQTLTGVASGGDHSTKQSQSSCMKVGGRAGEKAKSFSDRRKGKPQPSPRLSRYPRRAVSCKSYKEDDYCVDCHEVFEGGCSKHSLTIIKDNPSPKGSKDKARKTLPDGLAVKQSSIPAAGQGIFATNFIPKGYLFIPYAGDIVDLELGNDSSNALEICTEGKPRHSTDCNSEQTGNWMRCINCAHNEDSGLYRCEYCGSLYTIPLFLARHLKYKHGHYRIVPQVCNMTFNVTTSLFLIAAIACLTEGCCPDKFTGVGDRCYHYSSYKRTWSGADSACRQLGAHLVSIHSSAESAEVYDLWKSYTDVAYADDKDRAYWIGFNDRSYEGSFKWSDGTSVNYVHWQSGAPNDNRGEDCVSPRNEGSGDDTREEWNDYDCNEEKSYFCYIPL